jgi:hypothetical protein
MRVFAAILNQLILLFLLAALAGTKTEILIILMVFGLPPMVLNVILASRIGRSGPERSGGNRNWLSLYLRRKALEEQAKIHLLSERC